MHKRVLYALLLIGMMVVVLLFNRQGVDIRLPFGVKAPMPAAFAYLIFTGLGVTIGALLK